MGGKRSVYLLRLLAITCLLIYVFLIPENHSEAEDAYWFARDLREANFWALWHPYHMIYLPLMRVLYSPFRMMGTDAFDFLIIANKVLGLLTLIVCYKIVQKKEEGLDTSAFLLTASIAVCYGFWRYSNVPEVYMLANFFNVLLIYRILKYPHTAQNVFFAGLLGAVAILSHATGISLALAAIPLFFLWHKNWGALFRFGITVGVVLLGVYLGVGFIRDTGIPSEGLFGQSSSHLSSFSLSYIPKSVFGIGEDILSGNFLFAFPAFANFLSNKLPNRMFEEEVFMGEKMDPYSPYLVLFFWLLMAVILIRVVIKMSKTWSWAEKKTLFTNPPVFILSAWVLAFTFIAIQKSTSNPERWLLVMVPFTLLLYFLFSYYTDIKGSKTWASWFVFLLFMANLLGGFFPIMRTEGDYNAQKASWLLKHVGPKDLVLTLDNEIFSRYVGYYAPFDIINIFSNEGAEETRESYLLLEEKITQFPHTIYATSDVFHFPTFYYSDNPRAVPETEKFSNKIKPDFVKVFDNEFGGIYQRLNPP